MLLRLLRSRSTKAKSQTAKSNTKTNFIICENDAAMKLDFLPTLLLLLGPPLVASFHLPQDRWIGRYGRLLVVRQAETRPGPSIDDWSKTRVPFLNVKPGNLPLPYGLNVEVTRKGGEFESVPHPGVATSLVWAFSGNTTYLHPECRPDFPVGEWLRSRPSLGIALSGGGMRAASTCLGW